MAILELAKGETTCFLLLDNEKLHSWIIENINAWYQ